MLCEKQNTYSDRDESTYKSGGRAYRPSYATAAVLTRHAPHPPPPPRLETTSTPTLRRATATARIRSAPTLWIPSSRCMSPSTQPAASHPTSTWSTSSPRTSGLRTTRSSPIGIGHLHAVLVSLGKTTVQTLKQGSVITPFPVIALHSISYVKIQRFHPLFFFSVFLFCSTTSDAHHPSLRMTCTTPTPTHTQGMTLLFASDTHHPYAKAYATDSSRVLLLLKYTTPSPRHTERIAPFSF